MLAILMTVDFFIDPVRGEPHIHRHGVSESEVIEALDALAEDRPGGNNSRVAIGRTSSGKHLRLIYVRDPEGESIFVITAYELTGNSLTAFRRRRRRKR